VQVAKQKGEHDPIAHGDDKFDLLSRVGDMLYYPVQAASEIDLPSRHSSVAARIALSAGVSRSEFRQSRTARISSGGIPAVVATRQCCGAPYSRKNAFISVVAREVSM